MDAALLSLGKQGESAFFLARFLNLFVVSPNF